MFETERKRVTLHPLNSDGTINTRINLYPKTFIDGIVDRSGLPVEVQQKLIAGEGITIDENNVISSTGGSIVIPEYTIHEDIEESMLRQIFNDHPEFFKLHVIDDSGSHDEGEQHFFCISGNTSYGKIQDKDYTIYTYFAIVPFAEIEGRSEYRLDTEDVECIVMYLGKVDGSSDILFDIRDFSLGLDEKDIQNVVWDMWENQFKPYVDEHSAGNVRGQQMTATIIVDPITNINGRRLDKYGYRFDTRQGYKVIVLDRVGSWVDYDTAADYMEYMTGSRYVPTFDYERPQNSVWIMADGSIWKPQWDDGWGMCLYAIPNPFAINLAVETKEFSINREIIDLSEGTYAAILSSYPVALKIDNMLEVYLHSGNIDSTSEERKVVYTNLIPDSMLALVITIGYSPARGYYSSMTVTPIGGTNIEWATDEDIANMFIKYTHIWYNLGEGVSLSNQVSEVITGEDWGTEVYVQTPPYYISSVAVMVDGNDISGLWLDNYGRYVWDSSTNTIFVPHVNKDITISVNSERDWGYHHIDVTLENCTGDGIQDYVYDGNTLSCSIVPMYGYTQLDTRIQDSNWNDVTSDHYSWIESDGRGYIYIASVYEDYHIYARGYGGGATANIYASLNDCYLSNNPGQINLGESWYSYLYSNTEGFNSVSFEMIIDGERRNIFNDGTYNYVSEEKGNYYIHIPEVTGDIYVTAEASGDYVNIYLSLDHVTADNSATRLQRYSSYHNRFVVDNGYTVDNISASMNGTDITNYIREESSGVFTLDLGQLDGDLYVTMDAIGSSHFFVEYYDTNSGVYFDGNTASSYGYRLDNNVTEVEAFGTYFNTFYSDTIETVVTMYVNGQGTRTLNLTNYDGWYYASLQEEPVMGNLKFEFSKPQTSNLITNLINCSIFDLNPNKPIVGRSFSCTISPYVPWINRTYSVYDGSMDITSTAVTEDGESLRIYIDHVYSDIIINVNYEQAAQTYQVTLNPDQNIGYSNGSQQVEAGHDYSTYLTSPYTFTATVEQGGSTSTYTSEWNGSEYAITIDLYGIYNDVTITCNSNGPHYVYINNIMGANGITWTNDARQWNKWTEYTNFFEGPGEFHILIADSYGNTLVDDHAIYNGNAWVYNVNIYSLEDDINICVGYPLGSEVYITNPIENAQVGQTFEIQTFSHYLFSFDVYNDGNYDGHGEGVYWVPGIYVGNYTVQNVAGTIGLSVTSQAPTTYRFSTNFTNCDISPTPSGKYIEGSSYNGTISGMGPVEPTSCEVWMGGTEITSSAVTLSNNEYLISIPYISGDIIINATFTEVAWAITSNFTNADFLGGPAGAITEVAEGANLNTTIVPTIASVGSKSCTVTMGGVNIIDSSAGTVTENGDNFNIDIWGVYDSVVIDASYSAPQQDVNYSATSGD